MFSPCTQTATHVRAFPAFSSASPSSPRSRPFWLPRCFSSAVYSQPLSFILQKQCRRCATHDRAFPGLFSQTWLVATITSIVAPPAPFTSLQPHQRRQHAKKCTVTDALLTSARLPPSLAPHQLDRDRTAPSAPHPPDRRKQGAKSVLPQIGYLRPRFSRPPQPIANLTVITPISAPIPQGRRSTISRYCHALHPCGCVLFPCTQAFPAVSSACRVRP